VLYQVKELAKLCQVPPDTIRHYTRIGLLQPTRDPINGYHQYSASDSKRLEFIRKAKSLGFSLKEIDHILNQSQKGESPCPLVRDMIRHRILSNRKKLNNLLILQKHMEAALAHWEHLPDGIPDGNNICYLIESMMTD
jgi:MerR family transcriptional regulator, Zn(II)-responsive regulator of zntA